MAEICVCSVSFRTGFCTLLSSTAITAMYMYEGQTAIRNQRSARGTGCVWLSIPTVYGKVYVLPSTFVCDRLQERVRQLRSCGCFFLIAHHSPSRNGATFRPLQLVYMYLVRTYFSGHAGGRVLSNLATAAEVGVGDDSPPFTPQKIVGAKFNIL